MKIRIVFDPYVFVAAALVPDGASNTWLNMTLDPSNAFVVFVSDEINSTIEATLIEKFGFSQEEVQDFTSRIAACTEKVHVSNIGSENAVLACAEAVNANIIIAADPYLLSRHTHKGIGIYSPEDMKRVFPPNSSLEA